MDEQCGEAGGGAGEGGRAGEAGTGVVAGGGELVFEVWWVWDRPWITLHTRVRVIQAQGQPVSSDPYPYTATKDLLSAPSQDRSDDEKQFYVV